MSEITVGKVEFESDAFASRACRPSEFWSQRFAEMERPINDAKARLIAAERRIAEAKEILSEYSNAVKALAELVPVGYHFQDEDGIVYQLAEQEGKFVYFDRHTIKRTRREGERQGSLSLKAAEELGYQVKEAK